MLVIYRCTTRSLGSPDIKATHVSITVSWQKWHWIEVEKRRCFSNAAGLFEFQYRGRKKNYSPALPTVKTNLWQPIDLNLKIKIIRLPEDKMWDILITVSEDNIYLKRDKKIKQALNKKWQIGLK